MARRLSPLLWVSFALLAPCSVAKAQSQTGASPHYPTKPIRFIVPYPAGGPADTVARMIGQHLTATWGQGVVVDDRGGGGGLIAAEMAAKSPPDGHTLFLGAIQTHAINPALYAKLPYDPIRDFAPITPVSFDPLLLVIHPAVGAATLKELVALAKARPGQLNYASTGTGGSSQLAMELLKSIAGINLTHVPYKGATPAITDMISGQTQVTFLGVSGVLPHVRGGRLKALGISSAKRSAVAPEIPTIAESGYPGFEVITWYGVVVPAGTPREIQRMLSTEISRIVRLPDVKDRLAASGADAVSMTPEQFGAFIKSEMVKWAKVIKEAGIKAD
jgi:tripartite-type tricarboxylate transporter receptor subunit TctC